MNLGCGIPTQFAGIKKGDSVLDLGSGAGNDCFVKYNAYLKEIGDIADIPQNKHLQSYSEREDDTDAKKDLIKNQGRLV